MAQWIDEFNCYSATVGAIGFLVRRQNQNHGCVDKYSLCDRPAHTNRSHEPMLTGWCGTTNNVAVFAEGMAKVARITRNGRVLLGSVTHAEQEAALEDLGYPDLE